jgi:hypothetical protein
MYIGRYGFSPEPHMSPVPRSAPLQLEHEGQQTPTRKRTDGRSLSRSYAELGGPGVSIPECARVEG